MRIFFTPLIVPGVKPWAGHTIYEQALGGSESAVVYLAREFARRGHDVTVFTTGQPGTYEKVKYLPQGQIPVQTPGVCDVWISSRWEDIFSQVPDTIYKVLWLHDMAHGGIEAAAHKVVMLTQAHAASYLLYPPYPPHIFIEGDGVDLTLAAGYEDRDPNRLMWISNPDRGLWIAAEIFVNQILPRWPDMTLEVYGRASVYGWPAAVEEPHLPLVDTLKKADGRIKIKEPLPRLALVRRLMSAFALWYPTYWPETYCMSALESQAAGTPVVTSPVGALTETVKGGIVGTDFVNAISQLRNGGRWKKLSDAGKEYAAEHSWAKVASRWENNVFGGQTQ